MPYDDVLVHTGRPVVTEETGPKVSGRPQTDDVLGTPFDCCLFLPAAAPEEDRSGRRVKRPLLLLATLDRAGELLELSAEKRITVLAPELTGPDPVEWQVEGDPQKFGPPGDTPVGSQVNLRRVVD